MADLFGILSQLQGLKGDLGATLPGLNLSNIDAEGLKSLGAEFFKANGPQLLSKLGPDIAKQLGPDFLSKLGSDHLSQLGPDFLSKLGPEMLQQLGLPTPNPGNPTKPSVPIPGVPTTSMAGSKDPNPEGGLASLETQIQTLIDGKANDTLGKSSKRDSDQVPPQKPATLLPPTTGFADLIKKPGDMITADDWNSLVVLAAQASAPGVPKTIASDLTVTGASTFQSTVRGMKSVQASSLVVDTTAMIGGTLLFKAGSTLLGVLQSQSMDGLRVVTATIRGEFSSDRKSVPFEGGRAEWNPDQRLFELYFNPNIFEEPPIVLVEPLFQADSTPFQFICPRIIPNSTYIAVQLLEVEFMDPSHLDPDPTTDLTPDSKMPLPLPRLKGAEFQLLALGQPSKSTAPIASPTAAPVPGPRIPGALPLPPIVPPGAPAEEPKPVPPKTP